MPDIKEQAAVLALVKRARKEWYLVAQLLESTGSARALFAESGVVFEPPKFCPR